ncbi:putative ribonuclease H-like domain-containing protein [Tanacetum coccineum]
MTKNLEEHGLFSSVQQRTYHKEFQNCLFACFLSQVEPKKVWTLVDLPNGKRAIGTKWVFRNKKDERVARIEAIRLFLAYAPYKDFVVYEMDVKSALLYGKIKDEGKIDKTLFIKKDKREIMLVQVYVDDISFGSTKKTLCTEFEKMMHKKFQMSSMGELTFHLGLQVKCQNSKHTNGHTKAIAQGSRWPDIMFADSPLDLVAYTDSDYVGASLDRKLTTVKNPVFYSKTKHIEIRHHFISDSHEKKLIQMIKIHTDKNVANLLTKSFDCCQAYLNTVSNCDYCTKASKQRSEAKRLNALSIQRSEATAKFEDVEKKLVSPRDPAGNESFKKATEPERQKSFDKSRSDKQENPPTSAIL